MKAFWWFKEDLIAGMARPGFNATQWFEFPFDEAVLLGWVGQFSSGSESLNSFRKHLHEYAPKIYKFYGLNETTGEAELKKFDNVDGIKEIGQRLLQRSNIFKSFDVTKDHMHFDMCHDRLQTEIDFLKKKDIKTIVTLTEHHHSRDTLDSHFGTHHFSIQDLNAPRIEQVLELAEVLKESKKNKQKVAVHCLAGIGRTSTMLIAAHIVMGEDFDQLKQLIAKQNPSYTLTGPQGAFVHQVLDRYGR